MPWISITNGNTHSLQHLHSICFFLPLYQPSVHHNTTAVSSQTSLNSTALPTASEDSTEESNNAMCLLFAKIVSE